MSTEPAQATLPDEPVEPELPADPPPWEPAASMNLQTGEVVKAPHQLERLNLDGGLSLAQVGDIGRVFTQSGYFKDTRDAAQAITKILAGQEIGIPPFQAMSQFHVIEGKPTMSSALIGGLVKRSGRYNFRPRETTATACEIDWYENGEKVGTSRFTIEDAQRAKLVRAGSGWEKFPTDMLVARALTAGARRFCPDVFGGAIYVPSELDPTREDGE